MPTLEDIIRRFALSPLSGEGGLFRRTYASTDVLSAKCYGERYAENTKKEAGSAIMYMVTPETWSHLHTLPTDEIYHFYLGDPVELFLVSPDGAVKTVTLGQDVMAGMEVQYVVPAGWIQGSCLKEGGEWALLGTTMAPAYTPDDYSEPDAAALLAAHPEYAETIRKLSN